MPPQQKQAQVDVQEVESSQMGKNRFWSCGKEAGAKGISNQSLRQPSSAQKCSPPGYSCDAGTIIDELHFGELVPGVVFLPPFARKLATPSKRNPSLQAGRSVFHRSWQNDPPDVRFRLKLPAFRLGRPKEGTPESDWGRRLRFCAP